MKNSIELKESRAQISEDLEIMLETAKSEDRNLTSDENTKMDELILKSEKLDKEIEKMERAEKIVRDNAIVSGSPIQKNNTPKDLRTWSLFKAVNEIRNGGQLTGIEAEMHQEAENENRGGMSGIGMPSFMTEKRAIDQGGSAIQGTSVGSYADSLLQSGVYSQVGLNNLGTMASDTIIPIAGGSSVAWASEVATQASTGADFGKVVLQPKRLSGLANVSNTLLAQNGTAAENAIMRDLGRHVANKIDAAMFGSSDVSNAPGSIVGTSGTLTFTEAASADLAGDALSAIQAIADNHGLDGNNRFVYNWAAYSGLMQDAQVASVKAALENDRLLGYPVNFSDAPAKVAGTSADGMFGDFSRVYFATFGPSSILVDQFTNAADNEIRLVLNQNFGWGVAGGASFVKFTSLV